MELRAIKNRVLATRMEKGERRTAAGIVIPDDNGKEEGIRARWGLVYSVGPEVQADINVGDWILVEHGRWTRPMELRREDDVMTRAEVRECVVKADRLAEITRDIERQVKRYDRAKASANRIEISLTLAETNMNNAERQYYQCYDYNCKSTWRRHFHTAKASYNRSVNNFNAAVDTQNSAADALKRLERSENRAIDWLNSKCVNRSYRINEKRDACANADPRNQFCN